MANVRTYNILLILCLEGLFPFATMHTVDLMANEKSEIPFLAGDAAPVIACTMKGTVMRLGELDPFEYLLTLMSLIKAQVRMSTSIF